MLAKALKELRILHTAFVTRWFLFVIVIQVVKPPERSVPPMILFAITAVAASDVVFGVALKFLGASWPVAGVFFFLGFALLLLWTPRMDIAGAVS